MNKGEIVKFSDLQIGDYFSDNMRQKYRKTPPFDLPLGQSSITLNAFDIQSHAPISLISDDKYIFIKHANWVQEEKFGFSLTIEESELEHQLEFLNNYLETLEATLRVETESTPYEFDDAFDKQKIDEFVALLRSSFFVSIYSYLETKLINECRSSQKNDPNIKISLDDIHGTGISRAKTYIVKVLDTSFSFDADPHWEQIQWYNKIRNCIVHNEGKVVNKELKKYIESHSKLFCEMRFGDDYVVLDNGFCEEALSIIGTFLTSLLYHRQADKII